MAGDQNPPRKHHYVPQLLLRRFARDGKLLARVERNGGVGKATPKSVCWDLDFHTLEGLTDVDPLWIEHLSDFAYERPAGPMLKAITAPGGFPPTPDHRRVLARFVAWQFARGPDMRAYINTPVRFTVEFLSRTLGRVVERERLAQMLGEVGLPVDAATGDLRKNPMLALVTRTADHLTPSFRAMQLVLVRFPEPALITSDRPVVQWGKIGPETNPYGVGLDVPHSLSFHLDPRHALLFVPVEVCGEAWGERVVEGTAGHADVLNERAAQWAWERVFHHPDHDPLRGRPLPARRPFDEVLGEQLDKDFRSHPWPIRALGRWFLRR